ncbi:MAG: lysophospholipid acyltransferase family protein [Deltaproteobacteria bacterium]|nr:lysophospholipid acyltransferase family protein [Deltaproteobacteria bacterium]
MGRSKERTAALQLDLKVSGPLKRAVVASSRGLIHRVVSLGELNRLYGEISRMPGKEHFFVKALRALNIRCEVSWKERERIPGEGPLIVTANHPFGGIDGMVLGALMLSVRPDVRFLANYFLSAVPELREMFFAVDPFGGPGARRANVRPLRECMRWVKGGECLVLFPSGEVSHLQVRRGGVADPAWHTGVGKIIRKSQAPVLPVFLEGRNSNVFQLLGLVHPLLRTLMLPREMMKKNNRPVRVRVGTVIPGCRFAAFAKDEALIEYVRLKTYMLGDRKKESRGIPFPNRRARAGGRMRALVRPQSPEVQQGEIYALPREQVLVENGRFAVFQAAAEQIPSLLRQIGRLREETFRSAGEGTGKSIDLDRHDAYYTHVFLWNREAQELVGAYRLGRTDLIEGRYGVRGLYTHSLFEINRAFLDRIGPALELGRSFVRIEYQKTYQPLLMLWKGIARFVFHHPQYRMLFGPVSINRDYDSISRQLMFSFLRENNQRTDLACLVRPRTPYRGKRLKGADLRGTLSGVRDVQELSDLISEIEEDRKGIPVLLKHYLRLGGQILSFNIDRSFSDVLDALVLVDLAETDPRILARYMGRKETSLFLDVHHAGRRAECA